jgi:hypothetical protein
VRITLAFLALSFAKIGFFLIRTKKTGVFLLKRIRGAIMVHGLEGRRKM